MIKPYKPTEAYIVNMRLKKKEEVGKSSVIALPHWELLQKGKWEMV